MPTTLTSDLVPAPEEEEEEGGDKDSGPQHDKTEDTEGIEGEDIAEDMDVEDTDTDLECDDYHIY